MDLHSIMNISAASKPNGCGNFSPEGSSMELDTMEQLDHTLNSYYPSSGSDSYESPSGSPCSDLQAFILQEYSMPILTAYGLPTAQSAHQSVNPNIMLPYPDTTQLLEAGNKTTTALSQTSYGQVHEAPKGQTPPAPSPPYFQSQAIRDWSGACSSSFSIENVPPPHSSSADNLFHNPSEPVQNHGSRMPLVASSHEWSAKNKLNLTVDTNMSAFKYNDKLSSNYRDSLTSYSDSGNSYLAAPSLHAESNYSTNHVDVGFASCSVPSQPNVVDWLTSNIQYQHLNIGASNFDQALPTPSSATFSALPTPTTTNFSNEFSHHSLIDIGTTPTTIPSPPYFELATNFASVPYLVSEQLLQSNPMAFNFSDHHDFQSLGELNSKSYSTNYDHSSIFGHLAVSNQELCGQLRNTSLYPSNQNLTSSSPQLAMSTVTTAYLNNSTNSEDISASRGELPSKKRRSPDSVGLQKENIDPFRSRSSSSATSPPAQRGPAIGSRLKPGPKAKTTIIQHPPPSANLMGLNPVKETCGIPKDILKCLYEIVDSEDSNKRFICKLDGCGRTFPRKTAVETHLQTHLEDKPFVCDVKNCNAAFVRQHDLRRHQQIHSNSKPFNCICGKGFARGDALMRHRQRNICVGSLGPRRY